MTRPPKPPARPVTFRLPLRALAALDWLAHRRGLTRTARVVMLIMDAARAEGWPETEEPTSDRA
jgi:hypothetical protein